MANNYYSEQVTFIAGSTARAEDIELETSAIIAGFDKLPVDSSALVRGTATFVTETGAADAYTFTMNPVRTAYADGDMVTFRATASNTGASTMAFDALTVVPVVDASGTALSADQINAGLFHTCIYDLTNARFILISPSTTVAASASAAASAASATAAAASASLILTLDTGAEKTANFTGVVGKFYRVDTSGGAFAMTLPLSPSAGDAVGVIDVNGTFSSNNLTLTRNGSNVFRSAADGALDINNWAASLIYVDSVNGWIVKGI